MKKKSQRKVKGGSKVLFLFFDDFERNNLNFCNSKEFLVHFEMVRTPPFPLENW